MATKTEYYIVDDDEDYVESGISTAEIVGQTFTIGTTTADADYLMTSVDIKLVLLGAPTATTITAEIFELDLENKPVGTAISTGTSAIANFSDTAGGTWTKISMENITLKKSTTYGLVVYGNGTVGHWRADGTAPAYAGGNAIWSDDTGATWTIDTTSDLMFSINTDYLGTIASEAEMNLMAGKNLDPTGNTTTNHNSLISYAEAYLCNLVKYDIVTNWDSLNATYKKMFSEWAARFAGNQLIIYNPADYYDLIAAEDSMTYHLYRMQQIEKILENSSIQDFLKVEE